MDDALSRLLDELESRFHKIDEQYRPRKRFVKLKFNNFTQTTMEEVIPDHGEHWLNEPAYRALLHSAWQRGRRPVRLLGAGLRLEPLGDDLDQQLHLFDH